MSKYCQKVILFSHNTYILWIMNNGILEVCCVLLFKVGLVGRTEAQQCCFTYCTA